MAQESAMRWTGRLLIVLAAILSFGCASRGDWISETLTLVDVSGRWEGTILTTRLTHTQRAIRMVLQQRGAKVTGEMAGGGAEFSFGKIEGLVNGDVFTFQARGIQGEATVDGAEMNGRASGDRCPCSIALRRTGKSGGER
jgi:hypothetical protein